MKPRPPVPDDLTREDQLWLWAWVKTHHPHLSRHQVRGLVNECLLHWGALENPKGYKVWRLVCAKWIGVDQKWQDARREARPEVREDLFAEPQRLRVVK